jgi:hypothetical protein
MLGEHILARQRSLELRLGVCDFGRPGRAGIATAAIAESVAPRRA